MKVNQDPNTLPMTQAKNSKSVARSKVSGTAAREGATHVDPSMIDDYAVNLSSDAKETKRAYEKAHKIAMETPDVRESKVKEYRDRIQNGSYVVDSGNVADGILREAVRDRLAMSNHDTP